MEKTIQSTYITPTNTVVSMKYCAPMYQKHSATPKVRYSIALTM